MTESRFEELLKKAVEAVKSEEDPVELNQYRKLYKKNVPMALRMYVAAYLAKNAAGEGGRRDSYRNRRDANRGRQQRTERDQTTAREPRAEREPPAPRVTIDEALAATIFISIGRNRKVFPRDLIGLIVQNANIERSRIGDIRVLDNYSFVQLYAEDAENVISALDGMEYRGRKLTVSYSRKKSEEDQISSAVPEAADPAATAEIEVTDTTYEEEMSAEDAAAFKAATKAAESAGNSFLG